MQIVNEQVFDIYIVFQTFEDPSYDKDLPLNMLEFTKTTKCVERCTDSATLASRRRGLTRGCVPPGRTPECDFHYLAHMCLALCGRTSVAELKREALRTSVVLPRGRTVGRPDSPRASSIGVEGAGPYVQ